MDKNIKLGDNPFETKKALSFFMVPFYYESEKLSVSNIWQMDNDRDSYNEDSDYLYPHIMNFLKGKMMKNATNNNALQVYKLDEESETYRFFWKKFASKTQEAKINSVQSMDSTSISMP